MNLRGKVKTSMLLVVVSTITLMVYLYSDVSSILFQTHLSNATLRQRSRDKYVIRSKSDFTNPSSRANTTTSNHESTTGDGNNTGDTNGRLINGITFSIAYQRKFNISIPENECPIKTIPGLVGRLYMDMTEVLLHKVEYQIVNLTILTPPLAEANTWLTAKTTAREKERLVRRALASATQPNITNLQSSANTANSENGPTFAEQRDSGIFDSAELYASSLENWAINTSTHYLLPGGLWRPKDCRPAWKVAIVIPFRDRAQHLAIFLRHLIPILLRQKLEFAFYVVEQGNNLTFNRAMLMNVGYVEALKFSKWDCFVLHDVDHLPVNDKNYYGCVDMPRLFPSGVDRWKYRIAYPGFFGAVSGITTDQIEAINGFPNVYWGWGGEDDEIAKRLKDKRFKITDAKGEEAYYDVIKAHHKSAKPMKERFNLLKDYKKRSAIDGLHNLRYLLPTITLHPLYTNITVDIRNISPT